MQKFTLKISPAIPTLDRLAVEDALVEQGYDVVGSGQLIDGSECDISFEKEEE